MAENTENATAKTSTQTISYGTLKDELPQSITALNETNPAQRLFKRDASLWKTDPEAVKSINNRLGWLILPDGVDAKVEELSAFVKEVQAEGFKYTVLLGMGGSSLCSEVARETYGKKDDFLELFVLDDTDPDAIKHLENQIDLDKTLFIATSKSGNTEETLSFYKYFYALLEAKGNKEPGKNFIAITDAGTQLVTIGAEKKFRKVFINPSDIGGRYSVLSDFGTVPMALMGVDIRALLNSAAQIEKESDSDAPVAYNPAVCLGAALGLYQKHGLDKVTFLLSPSIKSFGLWVEQLIAESTGKEGRGLIPIQGEQAGEPSDYGKDRVFIHMFLPTDTDSETPKKVAALEAAGHPVVRISLADTYALGGEYYRWEVATAIAGAVINVNPFDEPNVAEGKKNTNDILNDWLKDGLFKKATPTLTENNIAIFTGDVAKAAVQGSTTINKLLSSFTSVIHENDYVAILPYLLLSEERMDLLQSVRIHLRDKFKVATTLLNGPRYLHSTGQLHKGGPSSGVYIIITGGKKEKIAIPGEQYDFATLHQAQSLGDFRSLNDKKRRIIYIDLGDDIDKGLAEIKQFVS